MLRQLDQRSSAGMTITLEWDSETDLVWVRCEDEHTVDKPLLCYPVEPRDARFAFLHPFAATPLDEPRWLHEGPSPYANDDRARWLSESNQARTPGYRAADLEVTDETENTNARRRRWYHLLPILRPHIDRTELEYYMWWPV
jgi:hypothetical protein